MKRLIVCIDGTWEARASYRKRVGKFPTNVEKTAAAILKRDGKGVQQMSAYYPGLGSSRTSRISGGLIGNGISKTICEAYTYIVSNFILGEDQLYLFGFSRGAYTVRSLSGFMQWIGVIKKTRLSTLPECYKQYRLPEEKRDQQFRGEQLQDIRVGDGSIPIRFLGVWDTVGALGIPTRVGKFLSHPFVGFHDTELSRNVSYAYHALATHELRSNFAPTLWSKARPGQVVEQVWFSGSHCDVGGGNPRPGLSDIALAWMWCQASKRGLEFDPACVSALAPDPHTHIHHSGGGLWRATPSRVRTFGATVNERVHASHGKKVFDLPIFPQKKYHRGWRKADAKVMKRLRKSAGCHDGLITV